MPPAVKTLSDALPVTLPVTFPVRFAVIVPAEKLPEASRFTIVLAVLAFVAAFAAVVAVATLAAVCPPTVPVSYTHLQQILFQLKLLFA